MEAARAQATNDSRSGGERKFNLAMPENHRRRAFRRARWHSLVVRTLRVVLPGVAAGCFALYGAALWATAELRSVNVQVSDVRIDPTNLTMENPRYDGFAKDGSQYRVRAVSAVADLRMTGPIRLNVIDGELIQPTGAVTTLKAKWGTYDQKKDLLELYERIDVAGTAGLTAVLTRATVHAKENKIFSPEPVWAESATGTIRARSMAMDGKARTAAFRKDVEVTLKPDPAAAAKAASRDAAAASASGKGRAAEPPLGLALASGEPVVVTSVRLDVDDNARTALFRETVIARQGEARLEAPELDVLYEGRAALPGAAPAVTAASGASAPGQSLKSILARGGVVMTSRADRAEAETLHYEAASEQVRLEGSVVMTQAPDRRAVADSAVLDQRADTVLLAGNVVVTQAQNVLSAGEVAIDRKAGIARLTSPPGTRREGTRIHTLLHQPARPDRPGRPEATAPAAAPQPGLGALAGMGGVGGGFRSDPNAPINVEAARLDVLDREHRAIYFGKVVASQGDFVVRSEELAAHYSGATGLASGGPAAGGGTSLKRIEARKGVIVSGRDGQQASGEWANYDVAGNVIVMGGNVETRQGKNIWRLPEHLRLVIDLATGVTRTEAEPGKAPKPGPGPQVSEAFATSVQSAVGAKAGGNPACPKGAVCRTGRMELIIYPSQLEKSKAGAVPGGSAERAAKNRPAETSRTPKESSWSASTTPGSD